MAQRYGVLPSKVLKDSSLLDYNLDQRVAAAALEQEIKEKRKALEAARSRSKGRR